MGKPDGGSAFPREQGTGDHYEREAGMSLRDYFAAQFSGAMIAEPYGPPEKKDWAVDIARQAYELADAMLAEREKE
jgi:hypothetical protein